jgi:hypothetical protein
MVSSFPNATESVILALVVLQMIWVGHLIKSRWTARNEAVPVPVAIFMFIGMIAAYALVSFIFSMTIPEAVRPDATVIPDKGGAGLETFQAMPSTRDRRFLLMMWCMIAWWVPALYYINILRNSMAANAVDRIGPFSAHIEEPSEFAEARRLALRGDIDGAVALYRNYERNRSGALLEAARLLKSHDRFADAAKLYDEIADRFRENIPVWAEATLQLGRIHENNLRDKNRARALYESILERAPDTRFAQAADTDLARMLMVSGQAYLAEPLHEDEEDHAPVELSAAIAARAKLEEKPTILGDDTIPPVDPFFAAQMRRSRELKTNPEASTIQSNANAPGKSATPAKKPLDGTTAKPKAKAKAKTPAKSKAKTAATTTTPTPAKAAPKTSAKARPKKNPAKKKQAS